MLGLALLLTLLFLKEHQGKEPSFCRVSAERVVGLSGVSLKLQPPPIETKKLIYVEWKRRVFPASKFSLILKWKNMSNCCNYENWTSNHINKKFNFITTNFSLIIQAAEHQDSGFYILAVTDEVGGVKCHEFEVSVFDHVGEPHILQDQKVLDGGRCQVILSCSVSRGGIVSYDWYRGSRLIETARNLSRLEDQIDANSSHTYTCNVSNSVSWVNHTFIQHCRSDSRHSKQSRPEEFLTVYEDVNNVQIRRNQEEKLNPPGEGNTIYSMIQSQPSASTSQETNTLYALVQTSRKSESKKSHRSSLNNTIYEEVGKRQLKAQNPGRLSRRELENFCVYS
ncbi:natural killer cell receptor 2B4 isoform X3 [Hyaena hyaena]|uniref:natural killer cell receptor 2B4 isoform X3 n=1 Tax=Hyaena hyaena TaxID=95912 RepID=UPI001920768E|nr:natural killer cell receptor 2B4 isoform X3 [Hyaena hyaena]